MILPHEYPVVGVWYWDIEHAERFEIVAKDDETSTLELQYFDGEVEEIDMDTWFAMRVVSIDAPEDWSGPFEIDKDLYPELGDEVMYPHHDADDLEDIEDR